MELPFVGKAFPRPRNSGIQNQRALALETKAKSLTRVRSAGTLPWPEFDRVQANKWVRSGKNSRINALDGVALTD